MKKRTELKNGWLNNNTGENHMTWFIGILKTHARKAVKELLPGFEGEFSEKIDKKCQDIMQKLDELKAENKKLHRSVEKLEYQLHKKRRKNK